MREERKRFCFGFLVVDDATNRRILGPASMVSLLKHPLKLDCLWLGGVGLQGSRIDDKGSGDVPAVCPRRC